MEVKARKIVNKMCFLDVGYDQTCNPEQNHIARLEAL